MKGFLDMSTFIFILLAVGIAAILLYFATTELPKFFGGGL